MAAMPSTYTVQCCVDEQHIRPFRAMLICLDRFGKELFLEASKTEISLRTLNQAQSAFTAFSLKRSFFADYHVDCDEPVSVKLHLKNVVSIFRTINGLSRVWLQLACSDSEAQAYMRIQLQCANGMRKKFDIALKEVTPMSAIYSRENCVHRIAADPSKIIQCLSNFPTYLPEVTLVITKDHLHLKNESDTSTVNSQKEDASLRTEMILPAADLDLYELTHSALRGGELPVSFSLKEFRAVLQLLRELDHRLLIHLEDSGKPLIFTSESRQDLPDMFVMECVLATVVDEQGLGDDEFGDFGDAYADFQPTSAQVAGSCNGPNEACVQMQSCMYSQPHGSIHPQGPVQPTAQNSFVGPQVSARNLDASGTQASGDHAARSSSFGSTWGPHAALPQATEYSNLQLPQQHWTPSQSLQQPQYALQAGSRTPLQPPQDCQHLSRNGSFQLPQQATTTDEHQVSVAGHTKVEKSWECQAVAAPGGVDVLPGEEMSGTEEDDNAVPGTPPDPCSPVSKRLCVDPSLMCH